jgi:excisionase family DNA binding protein
MTGQHEVASANRIDETCPKLDAILAEVRRLHETGRSPWSPWLKMDAAAQYSSLSTKTLGRFIKSGKLKAYRPTAGSILLKRDEIDAMIRATAGRRSTRGRKAGAANG